jgi:FKBP-type peptidyl-prolyl cis-trans isomerase
MKFLASNAKAPGVITTSSGLQYNVIREGTGPKPARTDTVLVHYEGRLLDKTVFDSSYKRGQPAAFPLDQVIPGWTEGVQLMPVGSKYHFVVPPALAYGARGAGGVIPPGAVLEFDIELLAIRPS